MTKVRRHADGIESIDKEGDWLFQPPQEVLQRGHERAERIRESLRVSGKASNVTVPPVRRAPGSESPRARSPRADRANRDSSFRTPTPATGAPIHEHAAKAESVRDSPATSQEQTSATTTTLPAPPLGLRLANIVTTAVAVIVTGFIIVHTVQRGSESGTG